MNGLTIIFYAVSISLCSLSLGQSILWSMFRPERRTKWIIVLESCLLFSLSIGFLGQLSLAFLSDRAHYVLSFIIDIMQYVMQGFLIVVIPLIVYSMISKPWGAKERVVFYSLGISYFACGLVCRIVGCTDISGFIQPVISAFAFLCSAVLLLKNGGSEEDRIAHGFCISVGILAACLVPLCIVCSLISAVRIFSYPFFIMPFSIATIASYHCLFRLQSNTIKNRPSLTREGLEKFRISDREFSVVQLIARGLTNKEIAFELGISVNTVNNHVSNIFEKINVRSRVELLRILGEGPQG